MGVVAGSALTEEIMHDGEVADDELKIVEEKKNHHSEKEGHESFSKSSTNAIFNPRPRLSKAERRRLKKDPKTMRSAISKNTNYDEKRKKNMRGRDFRDTVYFI